MGWFSRLFGSGEEGRLHSLIKAVDDDSDHAVQNSAVETLGWMGAKAHDALPALRRLHKRLPRGCGNTTHEFVARMIWRIENDEGRTTEERDQEAKDGAKEFFAWRKKQGGE